MSICFPFFVSVCGKEYSFHTECRLEAGAEGRGGRRGKVEALGGEEKEEVGELEGDFEVVGGADDGLVRFGGETFQEKGGFAAVGPVEEGGGLVEEDDGGVLGDGAGDGGHLAFAVGHGVEHPAGE